MAELNKDNIKKISELTAENGEVNKLLSEIKNIDWAVGRRIEERCGKNYVWEIKPDKSKTYRS